jgi:endonuclease YncB( thermonuclease family)
LLTFLNKLLLFTFIFSCTSSVKEISRTLTAKVIAVKDGDTIEIFYEGKPLAIRFAHVDCPEIRKSQPFGKAAKLFTSDHCFGQTVTVINEGKFDRYKRLIAVVVNEKHQNVNKELVKAGLAWHFVRYSTDATYAELEREARKNKIGLWQDLNPTAPWEWRKLQEVSMTN